MTKPQLLVVDDDLGLANLVGNVGGIAGFDVEEDFIFTKQG